MDFNLNLNSENVGQAGAIDPIAVEPDTPVRDVFALMKTQKTGSVLVCRDGSSWQASLPNAMPWQ